MDRVIRSVALGPPYDAFAFTRVPSDQNNHALANADRAEVLSHSQILGEVFMVAAVLKTFTIHPRERHCTVTIAAGLEGSATWLGFGYCLAQMEVTAVVGSASIEFASRRARVGQWVGGFYPISHFWEWPFGAGTPVGDTSLTLDFSPPEDVRDQVFVVGCQIEARTLAFGHIEAIVQASARPTFQVDVFRD